MNLFIGCSSKNEILPKYQKDCEIYLNKLLKENNLVFGADNTGLMGLSHNIAEDVINILHISNTAEDTLDYIEVFYKDKIKSKVKIKK